VVLEVILVTQASLTINELIQLMQHSTHNNTIYNRTINSALTSQFAVWLRKLGTILIDMLPFKSLYSKSPA